jgi:hypothetical protein
MYTGVYGSLYVGCALHWKLLLLSHLEGETPMRYALTSLGHQILVYSKSTKCCKSEQVPHAQYHLHVAQCLLICFGVQQSVLAHARAFCRTTKLTYLC